MVLRVWRIYLLIRNSELDMKINKVLRVWRVHLHIRNSEFNNRSGVDSVCGVAPLSLRELVTPHTHPPWQKGFRGARLRHRCQLYTPMKPQLASRAYELE